MNKINWASHILNFIAVISGVFLAFYVEYLAEQRKENDEAKEILAAIIEDLEDDYRAYNKNQIPINEEQVQLLDQLMESVVAGEVPTEEAAGAILNLENFSPTSSTYLSITSSGKINLIDDLKVRENLSRYYDILAVESIKKGEFQVEFFSNEILPWMIANTDLMDVDVKSLKGKAFLNKILLYRTFISNKIRQYKDIMNSSVILKKQLEGVLEEL